MFIVEKISMNFLEFSPGILLGFTIRIDHTAYAGFSSGILWRFFFQKQEFHGGSFPRISPGISQEIFENLSGTFSKKMHKKFHKNPRYHHFLQKIWQKFLRKKNPRLLCKLRNYSTITSLYNIQNFTNNISHTYTGFVYS